MATRKRKTNCQRESRYVRVARIALQVAQESLPRYSHRKSPHRYTFPQRAACALLSFYLNKSYRDTEEWLLATDRVCRVLGLQEVPDHTTLCRTYAQLRLGDLEQMKRALLDRLGVEEELIALGSTGFEQTGASAYYLSRRGQVYREWLKGVYAVGTASQLVLAWGQGRGPGNDAPFLSRLRGEARRWGHTQGGERHWLLADAGFDGRGVQRGELIPPVRRHGQVVSPQRKARAELVSAARLDGIYGQRWKSETALSVIKRRFGGSVRSRKERPQRREPAVKGLVYELHR